MDRRLSIVGFVAIVFAGFVLSTDGQTDRKRSTPKPTPTPSNSQPVVISRADDYPTVVIEPPPAVADGLKPDTNADTIDELRERLNRLEGNKKNDYDEKQKRLSLNLDILTKSEQRADGLRKQLFEMIEKENTIRGRMEQIDNDARPEAIERTLSSVGSLRPEELREQRRRSLALEKQNLQTLLLEVQKNRTNIESSLTRADILVERLRIRLEKEIDLALDDEIKDKP